MSMLMMLASKSGKCVSTRAAPLSLLFFSPPGEVILLSVRWWDEKLFLLFWKDGPNREFHKGKGGFKYQDKYINSLSAFSRREHKLTETRWKWLRGWNGTRSHNFSKLMFKVKLCVTLEIYEECPMWGKQLYLLGSCAISLFVDVLIETDSYSHFDFNILPANIPMQILYLFFMWKCL